MAVRECVVAEEAAMEEVHLQHLIRGDLVPPQDLGLLCRLLGAADTEHGHRLTHVAGREAQHRRGGEGADGTMAIMTDDAAPVATVMAATPDAAAAGVDREIDEVIVEDMAVNGRSPFRADSYTRSASETLAKLQTHTLAVWLGPGLCSPKT